MRIPRRNGLEKRMHDAPFRLLLRGRGPSKCITLFRISCSACGAAYHLYLHTPSADRQPHPRDSFSPPFIWRVEEASAAEVTGAGQLAGASSRRARTEACRVRQFANAPPR
jgi:hypothetical protein